MYFRLKPGFLLRGWKQMPWVLVKRPENRIWRLTRDRFQALLLCDGQTDVSEFLPDRGIESELLRCESDGIIEPCGQGGRMELEQNYQYYDNRYVEMIFWSITGKCNFRCRHCYMDAPDSALGELSTKEALELIDQMAACGVLRVDITGGEPFVRRDFWQLVDRIRSHKMVIGEIYTNGWLLNQSVFEEFARRDMKPHISVSFDGVGWHDWMRGIPGAEQAALDALRLCRP